MTYRIIDSLSEAEDREEVDNDWILFVTPLAEAIKIDVEEDPEALYVLPESQAQSIITAGGKATDVSSMPSGDYEIKLQLGVHRNKPIILVGDAGVGKTSWIHYFSRNILTELDVGTVHYNQKTDFYVPIPMGDNDVDTFESIFWYTLVLQTHKWLKIKKLTGSKLFAIKTEDIVEYGKKDFIILANTFKESMERIYEDNHGFLFVFLDNIDQYPKALQMKAFTTAIWLSAVRGVVALVALRPETLHDRMFDKKVHDPIIYTISPPSLNKYLTNRKKYLWDKKAGVYLKDVRNLLKDSSTTFDLGYTGVIDRSEKGLKKFHTNAIRALTNGKMLEATLYALHNNNYRDIVRIASSILKTSFFASEFKEGTESEPIPRLRKQEKIVTAYLRGMYQHYRPGTSIYPVRNINIFDETQIMTNELVITLRILQFIFARRSTELAGVKFNNIVSEFKRIGYSEGVVSLALVYLYRREFIAETVRQVDFDEPDAIKRGDKFKMTDLGDYVLIRMLSMYAFRYCEAVADIMPRPRPDGERWKQDKSFLSMIENAFGVYELILGSAEFEKKRLIDMAGGDGESTNGYRLEYFDRNSPAGGIVGVMGEECITRANFLMKFINVYPNYGGARDFKRLKEELIPAIRRRIGELASFPV